MGFRVDPGPCIICGAPHTSCVHDDGGVIAIPQLPNRDAMTEAVELSPLELAGGLPEGEFSTATYRGRGRPPGR